MQSAREALTASRRAPLLSALGVITIAFSLFAFGLFALVAINIRKALDQVDHMPTLLADIPVERFDAALAVNLRGVFLAMKYEIPAMLRTGGGAIVNMSSTAGHHGVSGLGDYVATKWGLEGLTRVAALDYAANGVRVNAIAPGPILTEGLAKVGPAAQEAAAKAMPMQRIGQPSEVAAAALWLSSDESAFVTGTTVIIDGGELAGVGNLAMRKTQGAA